MTIDKAKQFIYCYNELKKISHQLNRLYTARCTYELTNRQEKRQSKLQDRADDLAVQLSFICYHQTDPRGASIYLIDATCKGDYSRGIAI